MYKIRFVDKDKIKIFAFIVKTSCSENVCASVIVYELFFITWKSLQRNDFAEKNLVKWFYVRKGFGQMVL